MRIDRGRGIGGNRAAPWRGEGFGFIVYELLPAARLGGCVLRPQSHRTNVIGLVALDSGPFEPNTVVIPASFRVRSCASKVTDGLLCTTNPTNRVLVQDPLRNLYIMHRKLGSLSVTGETRYQGPHRPGLGVVTELIWQWATAVIMMC